MPRRTNQTRRNTQSASIKRTQPKKTASRPIWLTVLFIALVIVAGFLIIRVVADALTSGIGDTVTAAEAKTLIANGAMVVDVRTFDEVFAGHIDNSAWIPLEDLSSLTETLPNDRLIIVVCRTGVRSAEGRDILRQAGFKEVTSLAGGIQSWIELGYPITRGDPNPREDID
jgi:rhodanese-related sulfurtransferase